MFNDIEPRDIRRLNGLRLDESRIEIKFLNIRNISQKKIIEVVMYTLSYPRTLNFSRRLRCCIKSLIVTKQELFAQNCNLMFLYSDESIDKPEIYLKESFKIILPSYNVIFITDYRELPTFHHF